MDPITPSPPGVSPDASSSGGSHKHRNAAWPEGSAELARELHRKLAIPERDWHAFKAQRPRRAAEQIAAGLLQLLADDDPDRKAATPARERAIALIDHGLAWLKAERSDPGCPTHRR